MAAWLTGSHMNTKRLLSVALLLDANGSVDNEAAWLLALTIAEVVCLIRRRRNDDGNKSPYEMLMEKLLRPKDKEEEEDDECVICLQVAAKEEEEEDRWLRNRNTCPLCRSNVVAAAGHASPHLNAAHSMV
ncbi:hypothetical protein E2562_025210 [Oryza meyeriana var. granulata]|uniref:RING-type domain-containing protein n=1 Tax=Oryza meyeriana var. granulata TaxID=110450 RepID=A0A6G1E2B6_9ORYZ|nr:hypothetical protein E2562_025210 [Oryza meyeriana var. granulata]